MTTPYDAPIPGAAGQMNSTLLAKTAYQNTLARINRQRGQTLHQYGYKGDVDPTTGVMKNVAVDPMNQYGDFQSMLRNQAGQMQQAEWSAQDRGLRGGLANKAQGELHYAHGAQSAQLGTNFSSQFTDYQDQQTQAKYEYDRALYEQQLQDARDAIAAGNFSPSDSGDGSDGSDGGSTDNSDGWAQVPDSSTYPDRYTQGAANAVAGGYGGYVHAPGGGASATAAANKALKATKAKPSPKRIAKTVAKVTAAKGKPKYTQVRQVMHTHRKGGR